jgi:hypothetical protein
MLCSRQHNSPGSTDRVDRALIAAVGVTTDFGFVALSEPNSQGLGVRNLAATSHNREDDRDDPSDRYQTFTEADPLILCEISALRSAVKESRSRLRDVPDIRRLLRRRYLCRVTNL